MFLDKLSARKPHLSFILLCQQLLAVSANTVHFCCRDPGFFIRLCLCKRSVKVYFHVSLARCTWCWEPGGTAWKMPPKSSRAASGLLPPARRPEDTLIAALCHPAQLKRRDQARTFPQHKISDLLKSLSHAFANLNQRALLQRRKNRDGAPDNFVLTA